MSTLKLKGSTSGYVELTAPAIAGNNAITLPTTAGTLVLKDPSNNFEVGTGVTIGAGTSNTFTLSTNGSERIRVDSSGRLGIGTTNPTSTLQVIGNTNISGVLTATTASISSNASVGGVIVSGVTTVAAGSTSAPSITPTGDSNTGIFFPSADTIAFAEGGVEALRIDSSGNFGVGTKTPVSFSQQTHMTVNYSGSGTQVSGYNLSVNDTKYASIITYPSNTEGLRIATSTSLPLTFQVNNSEVGRFDTSGNLQVANGNLVFSTAGKGIDFSANANAAGMTSELLSDYEEGTWTPRISGTSGGNYTPGANNVGRYVKVGNIVTASATIHWTASVTPYSGLLTITGLPFTSLNVTDYRAAGIFGGQNVGIYGNATYPTLRAAIDWNLSFVYVLMVDDKITSGGNYSHTPSVNASGNIYGFTITYIAN